MKYCKHGALSSVLGKVSVLLLSLSEGPSSVVMGSTDACAVSHWACQWEQRIQEPSNNLDCNGIWNISILYAFTAYFGSICSMIKFGALLFSDMALQIHSCTSGFCRWNLNKNCENKRPIVDWHISLFLLLICFSDGIQSCNLIVVQWIQMNWWRWPNDKNIFYFLIVSDWVNLEVMKI